MKSQEVGFTAPKAGITAEVKFTIDQFPSGETPEAILADAQKLWGAAVCADNLLSMAVQKAGNKARAMANPDKNGVGKKLPEIALAMKTWKLGAISRAERKAFDPNAYVEALEDPAKIEALLKKLKERQAALAKAK